MTEYSAPGLQVDWLNGWLAAIGATVLLPGLRLRWIDGPMPTAVFESEEADQLPLALADRLPKPAELCHAVIARTLPDHQHEFSRQVTLESYRERAQLERRQRTGHLAASVTDLRADVDPTNLDHGAFDPPAPRGETLWSRALACAKRLAGEPLSDLVHASLQGAGRRFPLNGLGFDARRLPSGVNASGAASKTHADPVVELLVYAALPLFPVRANVRTRQRGWTDAPSRPGAFKWFAWRPALDCWAIDGLLDAPLLQLGSLITRRYRVVPYQPSGHADTTRAYFSEPDDDA